MNINNYKQVEYKEELLKKRREKYKQNKEYYFNYYKKNREAILERNRKNKAKIAEQKRQRYKKCKDEALKELADNVKINYKKITIKKTNIIVNDSYFLTNMDMNKYMNDEDKITFKNIISKVIRNKEYELDNLISDIKALRKLKQKEQPKIEYEPSFSFN